MVEKATKEVSLEWLEDSPDSCKNDPNCTEIGIEWINGVAYATYECSGGGGEAIRQYELGGVPD